ncbi:MAG: S-layer homology domain-containing protein [Pseudoflavonifractor sp.]
MKHIKLRKFLPKLSALVLALAMSLSLTAGAATVQEQTTMATALKALGLFAGYSDTDFGLADAPTREQALIFQVRAMGEDAAAKAWKGASPYSDVAANHWALPYIGYATEKGYTKGVGGGKFGLGGLADAKMMTTFVLRGLGYGDADFTYDKCLSFGKTTGILETDVAPATFTRGDAATILFDALVAKVKGTNNDLLTTLASKGAFTEAQLANFTAILDGKPVKPVEKPVEKPVDPAAEAAKEKAYAAAIGPVMDGYDALDKSMGEVITAVEKLPDGANITEYVEFCNEATKVLKDLSAALKSIEKDVPAVYVDSYKALVKAVDSYAAGVQSYVTYITKGDAAALQNALTQFGAAEASYKKA